MEILPKNSYILPEQCPFEIQEIKEISTKTDSSISKDQNKDITKKYFSHFDLNESSALMDRDEIFDGNTKTLLEQNQASDYNRTNNVSRHVIELSDNNSKMVLRQQFGEIAECGNSNLQNNAMDYENMEILRKLPPDTIVISYTDVKTKGISRTLRNKTLKTIEVRRNPMRVSKRNIVKDFSRPKQRLLANNKKEFFSDYEFGKRIKSSAMPYMNTRSVTRKMYTVGATYQAPTKKDETEWKEWPVHGMHERPIYHPQAGLAVEYLGKYFTSLDGLSYCEIINEPDIEVVSVDPYCNRRVSSAEKKLKGKMRTKNKRSLNTKDAWNTYLSMNNKSFETCMHESLHCVFGYCSQVMTPIYKHTVEEKITKLMISAAKTNSLELAKTTTNVKSNVTTSSENAKLTEETKLLEAYAIAMAQSIQNKDITNSTNDQGVASTFPSSSAMYVPKAQTMKLNSSKITSQNGEMVKMNLKQIIRDAPNSSLILLRSSATRSASGDACVATAKNIFNSAKSEDASNNETLMGMSIYKKLMFVKEPASKYDKLSMNNLHTLKRYATDTQEYTTKKTFFENSLDNKKTIQVKEVHESKNPEKIKMNRESDNRISITSSNKNFAWCTNKTSEIARILSEYNESTLRKSLTQNQIYSSRDIKTSLTNPSINNLPKNLWQKNVIDENQQFISYPNTSFDFPQGKWKRLHLMLEKTKDSQITGSNQNTRKSSSTLLENHKVFSKDQQMNSSTLNYIKKNSIDSHKDINKHEIIMIDVKPKEEKSKCFKDESEISKMGTLEDLLENTAILYCAANGVHQDDLSNYINALDSKQSIQWLETCNTSVSYKKLKN
ncbi:PREDICTED: uncharacterized protein LOC105462512 isoform X2 [Wasmannia auropunctata]|uniref:uncharacterized protein LOC105462512 isoform X2 n=1 Tax=Wasmannia auropunctata TaxID=64793 RepID=UPI0005F09491|nr:PREDICTED: uncharacterized protein LOC105462512 isoform X2 [Wasmannia auropunctata]